MLIESIGPVSSVVWHPEITNYLGLPKITGVELAEKFQSHFSSTGYPVVKEKATKVLAQTDSIMVGTANHIYECKSVILAVGVSRTKTLPGEVEYLGRGVAYCVTCDGALYSGQDVLVIGYIPEGEEEANALAGFAGSVTYIPLYEEIRALKESVKVVRQTPVEIIGNDKATGLITDSGEIDADGIFVIREAVPVATLLEELDIEGKFIRVDQNMATNIPGVYAAGDCTGMPFQIAKAVGQGQVAALSAVKHVHNFKRS